MDKTVNFKCKIIKETYSNNDFRIYAVDVNKKEYPDIKFSQYDNVTIIGEMHELGVGIEYEIKAIEQTTKYGYSYKVLNIKRDRPTDSESVFAFLCEVLTSNQAKELYRVYPDIIDKVIQNDTSDIDLSKLKGIGKVSFEKIKEKIIENYCLVDLVSEFQGYFSLTVLKRIYSKYSSIQLLKNKLSEDPYKCLCGLARVGFITADNILLELENKINSNAKKGKVIPFRFKEELKDSKTRCLACMLYFLQENEKEGHTLMGIDDLRKQCMGLVSASSQYFIECIKDKAIVYDKDTMVVALKKTYDTEKYISDKMLKALDNPVVWDFNTSDYAIVGGCKLSEEQTKILDYVCNNNISILNGSAGVGKSFSTQALIKMLDDNKKSYILLSPTGKAAKVLSEYTHKKTSTIHRGLGYMPPDTWCYNEDNKLEYDIVIIDEMSMTDIYIFKRVIEAIDFKRTKLLMIGDNAQLPSVTCGNLLHDFMESGVIPSVTLTKVFRYVEGGLMKVATDVRYSKPYLKGIDNILTWFGNNKDYGFVNSTKENIIQNMIELYKKMLKQGYDVNDIQVLTSYKKGDYGTVVINNELQKIANKNYGSDNYMQVGEIRYYKNDIVIQNVNNYKAERVDGLGQVFIANGETGIIEEVNAKTIIINFDGIRVEYFKGDMLSVGLGYCITIHKSQGSSIKLVILLTPSSHAYMLNSNLIYVGLTRMKEKCFHLGDVKTVNNSVKKKANLKRNTFMQSLLKEKE